MNRFVDKLNRVSQAVSQPLGFRAAQAFPPKPKILLVASLAQVDASRLADYAAGADACLLRIPGVNLEAETLKKAFESAPDTPCGGWLGDTSKDGVGRIAEAGFDFVVFPANTFLAMPKVNKLGRVLEVEASLADGLLRAVDGLPVDAVLIAGGQEKLTWQHLMNFQRFTGSLSKPLLVLVSPDVSDDELLALWEAGVDGIVVEVKGTGGLKELRQSIDRLAFPQRKLGKVKALLPRVSEGAVAEAEEEEEEEE